MVLCIVKGCSKRSVRDKDVSFYRIPKIVTQRGEQEYEMTKKRRAGYLAAICRDGAGDSKSLENDRICSRHFVTGKPAYLYDEKNPDWLPTLNLVCAKKSKSSKKTTGRRKKARNEVATKMEVEQSLLLLGDSEETAELHEPEVVEGVASQTDLSSANLQAMQEKLDERERVIEDLTTKLMQRVAPFSEESLHSDEIVEFYTGLPSIQVLKVVFRFVQKVFLSSDATELSPFQEFMATMLKLRLNSPIQDLAYRFNVSCATVSQIFLKWMTAMDAYLHTLILWPDRETLNKTMPVCFRASFGKRVAVIIDCFEILIERPPNLQARASTWSSCKHHDTVKVLLGIVPQGVVSFVSEAWGGCVSDEHLTNHCGILDQLSPGDVVLADRGCDINNSVGVMQDRPHILAFTKGESQLSTAEIAETTIEENVLVHVERAIGNVRQKYSILQGTLPIDYVVKRGGEECPLIELIVRVCCALCNLCDSVVLFD